MEPLYSNLADGYSNMLLRHPIFLYPLHSLFRFIDMLSLHWVFPDSVREDHQVVECSRKLASQEIAHNGNDVDSGKTQTDFDPNLLSQTP